MSEPERPGALSRNVRRIREIRGLSQEQLAARTGGGVTSSTIGRIETDDEYEPRMSSVRAIAAALGCRMVDLLADEDPGDRTPEPGDRDPEVKAS